MTLHKSTQARQLNLTWPMRLILILVLKLSLDVATVLVSAKALGVYSISVEYGFNTLVVGYFAALLLSISLPAKVCEIDALILWILVIFIGIPLLIPYQWAGGSIEWMLTCTTFFIALGVQRRVAIISVQPAEISFWWWPFGLLLLVVAVYSILSSLLLVGLSPTLDLAALYTIRNRFLAIDVPFANYLFTWTAYIIVPLVLTIGQVRRVKWLVALAFSTALVLFFATGHKIFLLAPPFVYAINFCLGKRSPVTWIVTGLTSLIVIGSITFHSIGNVQLNATFSNRLFVLPAKISYEYHEYFSENPKVMLSHSVLAKFIDYPYSDAPITLISRRYYNDPTGRPNTGFLSDAYMNFGYVGIGMLWPLVVCFLRMMRWAARRKDLRYVTGLVIIPIFQWANIGFLTSMLTGGLLLAFVGVALLPSRLEFVNENVAEDLCEKNV